MWLARQHDRLVELVLLEDWFYVGSGFFLFPHSILQECVEHTDGNCAEDKPCSAQETTASRPTATSSLSDSQRHTDTELLLDDSMWTTCWTLSNIIPNRKRRTSPQHSTAVICYLFPFCNYTVVCFLKIFYIVCMFSFVSTYVHILNKWLVRGQVCMLHYLHIFALFSSRGVAFQINKADVERSTNGSPPILNH